MILEKSKDLNIDLHVKNQKGETAFHCACFAYFRERTNSVEIMMKYADSFKIDLTAKDLGGETGFHLAKRAGCIKTVNVIKRKMPQIAS